MNSLEIVKISLNNNPNLNDEIRHRIYMLVEMLYKKIPEANLNRLSEKLRTVRLNKMSRFERRGIYYYDLLKNEILFSSDLKNNYDIDNLLVKALLEMSTATETYTGFNSNEKLVALNKAYTEILSNYIVGNEGDSDLEEEMLVANLLSHIIGKETLFNSYFSNDGDTIIKAMYDAEVGML